jgi:hypothetical protein
VVIVALALTAPASLVRPAASRAAGGSGPRFAAPVVLGSSSGVPVEDPAVAVAPSGTVVAAWLEPTGRARLGVVVRRGTTSGRFAPAQLLAKTAFGPAVATIGDGGAAVSWQTQLGTGPLRVDVAVARRGHDFAKPQELADVAGADPLAPLPVQLVAAAGRYVAVWSEGVGGHDSVLYAVSDRAGRFGATHALGATGATPFVSAAVSPDGVVTAAWYAPYCACGPSSCPACGSATQQIAFAQLTPGRTAFDATRMIRSTLPGGGIASFTLNSGPGGSALAWTETAAADTPSAGQTGARGQVLSSTGEVAPEDDSGPLPVRVRTLRLDPVAQASPVTVFALPAAAPANRLVADPRLALPADGMAPVATWEVDDWDPDQVEAPVVGGRVLASPRRTDGEFGAPVEVSPPGPIASQPATGATRDDGVIVWDSDATGGVYRLHYAVSSGGGVLTPARPLTPNTVTGAAVVASSPGAVVAAWISRGATGQTAVGLAILSSR